MHSVVACPRCRLALQLCRPIEIVPRRDVALLPNRARAIAHDTRPDARCRSADYSSLARNYSAIVNHAVNLTVHVYRHVPVSSLNGYEYENCSGGAQIPNVR